MAAADDLREPGTAPAHMKRVPEKRVVRRPLGNLYVALFIVVPLVLTALVGYTRSGAVEGTLQDDAAAALAEEKLADVRLELHGRVVTAHVPTGADPERVESTLQGVPGVAAVHVRRAYASEDEAEACTDFQDKLDEATNDQRIPFAGATTELTPNGQRMLRAVGGLLQDCRAAVVRVGGHADPRTSGGSTLSLRRAQVMVRFLRKEGVAKARLKPRGYGDQFPVSDGNSPGDIAANQRGSIQVERS